MSDETALIVRAGHLIPSAAQAPAGPHEVVIAHGRITSVRPVDPTLLTPEESRLLLMPALANAHDHGRGLGTLAFGAADQPLETWLPDLARQPPLDFHQCAAIAFSRMAASGIGVVNHCHNTQSSQTLLAEAEAVSRAARDVGVRVAFCWPFFDANPVVYGDMAPLAAHVSPQEYEELRGREAGMRDCATNLALMDQARAFEHALFTLQYHPVGPQWVQPATLEKIARAARDDGRRVHMHLLETRRQRAWADQRYPDGILRHFDTIGLLTPRLTVAHGVWLRPDECALLADRGVTVVVNTSSNLRLRSGLPPMRRLTQAGTPLAFGLDGMSLDDDEDMLRELRLVYHLGNAASDDGEILSPADILKGAWETGRKTIVGDDGGGRIVEGAPADIMGVDFAALAHDAMTSRSDVLSLLIGRAQKHHVRLLFVGGHAVLNRMDVLTSSQDASFPRPGISLFAEQALPEEKIRKINETKNLMKFYYSI
ncbi:amidohydrolase family protein [Nitrospirillum iridis]|uniref:Cytosine/adenosine deaminase-related metal-dependent hydrolase n=1 Tax=Nitrospirillum iridis TaxID=765888 RepID=A0A7X0B1C9_9PROT|nr:amidohydrolase family protein [Nitrospirillum iridis]MBB6253181.1 cytosine/adenosine deaminase-related metal-dependent hydrolase [Nitrospirillum iridis]